MARITNTFMMEPAANPIKEPIPDRNAVELLSPATSSPATAPMNGPTMMEIAKEKGEAIKPRTKPMTLPLEPALVPPNLVVPHIGR